MSRLADKQQRCELVNQAIRIIASYGRRFFYCKSQDTWASMEVDARGGGLVRGSAQSGADLHP